MPAFGNARRTPRLGFLSTLRIPTADDIRVEPAVLAESHNPILRGGAGLAALYYLIICFSHPFFETGIARVVLTSLAAATSAFAFLLWRRLRSPVGLLPMEAAAGVLFSLLLANVTVQMTFKLEPVKLVYFILLALIFATAAPTRRLGYASATAAMIGLVVMARGAPGDLIADYVYAAVASLFAVVGISTMMRRAVMRELRGRLATDKLNHALRHELARNQDLAREA